jgi:hypothetical protein
VGNYTTPHPLTHLTIADYDDYHGILPKCPSVTKAPPGLDAAQIQKNIDAAQQYLSNPSYNTFFSSIPAGGIQYVYSATQNNGQITQGGHDLGRDHHLLVQWRHHRLP